MAGPGEFDVTSVGKVVSVANAPIDGLAVTNFVVATEVIDGVDCVVLKAYAVRPAQKGQVEMVVGGETVVEDPEPVCIGTVLVLDPTTAHDMSDGLAYWSGTLLSS